MTERRFIVIGNGREGTAEYVVYDTQDREKIEYTTDPEAAESIAADLERRIGYG